MTKQILLSLLNCSWQWMLLAGLTWFITSCLFHKKHRSNTTVHLLWLLSLLSLPILFGLNQFVPALSIAGDPVPELTQVEPVNVSGLAALITDSPEISSTENTTQSENQLLAGGKSLVNWAKTDLLLCVWAIGALAMLVRFTFGLYRIHQLRRGAVVADDSYQTICRRLARQLDINRPVTVCFSDRVASPISFGWLSPHILIPRKLNLEQFELVAAHELAHVRRHDWLTNLFSHLVGVIFFFHPIYHFLNRELVHLRERICDDWVIQLTGARKNYAQCLLDLVRHRDRAIPLALSLNQPSHLESRIDAILKSSRRLDVQLKPRLQLIVATLLLTCLPLLAMAQLVPLKTFQVSLFAQTPEKSEKAVDKTEEKQDMQKAKAKGMGKKEYKDDAYIKVEDPTLFEKSEENKIFSGPQPGEKLPPLTVNGIGGRIEGTTFDITTNADGKPLVLFLQDTNGVGVKGLVNVSQLLLKIDAFQKRHSKATGAEKSNQGLQIGVVFLADSLDTLPDWAHNMLNEEMPNAVLKGISPDGREGPGSYGLNRNVAQTILIAKDGKVLHNFAFTQPMLYSDPHFLGAIAQTIAVEPATLEKWLNEKDVHEWVELRNIVTTELDTEKRSIRFTNDVEIPPGKVKYVIINESDDTSRDTHDWMELYNPTDKELNLKGWTLDLVTTELDTKGKYILFTNDVKVPPDGVLLVPYPESLKKLGITLEEDEQPLKAKAERGQTMEKSDARNREQDLSPEEQRKRAREKLAQMKELTKRFDKDGDGKLNREEGMAARRALANRGSQKWLTGDENTNPTSATVEKWLNEKPAEEARPKPDKKQMEAISDEAEELLKQLNTFQERLQRINETVAKTKGKEDRLDQVKTLIEQLNADLKILQREEESIFAAKTEGKEETLDHVVALVKQLNANLEVLRDLTERAAAAKRRNENRYRPENVEVKAPAEFRKVQGTTLFSGPQPGEKLPPLKAKGINGETKDKTFDVIAKVDGQLLVLFLQDETGLGLRGLLGISRLLARIAEKSEQTMHISAVFLGDAPDTLENQASKLVPHIPSEVLLGVSQEGREGPGSYGLNRNVAQTVIIAKDGKVLHNFAFTQPMLRPDPYVLGAVGDAIGVQPATLEKWLNPQNPVIEIKNPAEGGKTGEMLLNGNVVQFDELSPRLLNLPEKQKAMLTLQAGREVLHEQIVKVMDIAKEAGIDKIEFSIGPAEGLGKRLREMVEKGEITGEEARERYEKAFPRGKED